MTLRLLAVLPLLLAAAPPPHDIRDPLSRLLGGDDVKAATALLDALNRAESAGRYADAAKLAGDLAAFRAARQGPDHWQVRSSRYDAAVYRRLAALPASRRGEIKLANDAVARAAKAKPADAEAAYFAARKLHAAVYGEDHGYVLDVATNLGGFYMSQRRYSDAEKLFIRVAAARVAALSEDHLLSADAFANVGGSLIEQGMAADAVKWFRRAAESSVRAVGAGHPITAGRFDNLGLGLEAAGDPLAAEAYFAKALAIRLAAFGRASPLTLASFRRLGKCLLAQKKYARAEAMLTEALRSALLVGGPEHPDTVGCYIDLGLCLADAKKYDSAHRVFAHLVPLTRRVYGEAHPDTATMAANLAALWQNLGRDDRALGCHADALDLRRRHRGEAHRETIASRTAVGFVLSQHGRYAESVTHLERSLADASAALGDDHLEARIARTNLSLAYRGLGDFRKLEALWRSRLAFLEKSRRVPDADIVNARELLGAIVYDQRRYAEAAAILRANLALARKVHGEAHAVTANAYNGLGVCLAEACEFAEGEANVRAGLRIRTALAGRQNSVNVSNSLNSLAHILGHQGRYADGLPLLEKALAIRVKLLGPDHPDTATAYDNLGGFLDKQGDEEAAAKSYAEALRIRRRSLAPDHPSLGIVHNNLGACLGRLGKRDKALEHLLEAVRIGRKAFGDDHSETAMYRANLALHYADAGDLARAEEHYAASVKALLATVGPTNERTLVVQCNHAAMLRRLGRRDESEKMYAEALEIGARSIGPTHSVQLVMQLNRARGLLDDGKVTPALALLRAAATGYESARLRVQTSAAKRGLFAAKGSPYGLLACLLAADSMPVEAWAALEADTSRGLLDEAAARAASRLTPAQLARRDALRIRLASADGKVASLLPRAESSAEARAELAAALKERTAADAELAALAAEASKAETATLAEVQAALPADAAVVAWVDIDDHQGHRPQHWVCVTRRTGDPVWARLPGTGPRGEWTKADAVAHVEFFRAVADPASTADRRDRLARAVAKQRLGPVEKALAGATRLFVVSAGNMTGVPVELLAPTRDVVYVPSATWHARVKSLPAPAASGLLAVGIEDYGESKRSTFAALRSDPWQDLPGARVELSRLRHHFGASAVTLADADATPAALDALRASGKLAGFRRLHFAAHGDANVAKAFASSLILSGGERLSAEQVLRTWKLRADLVTLSACDTALGRLTGSDGNLGFAQAFLLAGSRSVCLTLWPVADAPTALLMDRFYANLAAGKPKAAALAEAKAWLRNLPAAEANSLTAKLADGAPRGKGGTLGKVVARPEEKPYAHPRFWAGFVLVGDPG